MLRSIGHRPRESRDAEGLGAAGDELDLFGRLGGRDGALRNRVREAIVGDQGPVAQPARGCREADGSGVGQPCAK